MDRLDATPLRLKNDCITFPVTMRLLLIALVLSMASAEPSSGSGPKSGGRVSWTWTAGRPYDTKDDDDSGWKGTGREFDVFGARGGEERTPLPSRPTPRTATRPSSSSYYPRPRSRTTTRSPNIFQSAQEWWNSNAKNLPKLQCRVEPTTTLKIRKTFRPLKTIVTLGADFNTQLGVWQFRSSWEDSIIGGKLTLAGRELQLTKSWQLSVGAVEDLVTRLRFRAAVDMGTMKAYARVGFRTERLSPINMVEGFTLRQQLPLDGTNGHVKLEVKANFALPEPEIEYSTESHRSLIGMGDMEVNIEELNLLLDY